MVTRLFPSEGRVRDVSDMVVGEGGDVKEREKRGRRRGEGAGEGRGLERGGEERKNEGVGLDGRGKIKKNSRQPTKTELRTTTFGVNKSPIIAGKLEFFLYGFYIIQQRLIFFFGGFF